MQPHTHLHFISRGIPYPPDNGPAMDEFYQLRMLGDLGVRVTLHIFQNDARRVPELLMHAQDVFYYKYRRAVTGHFRDLPYAVQLRKHPALLRRLRADNSPVLFQGIKTTAFLPHPALGQRQRIVRVNDVQSDYYQYLQTTTENPVSKAFYKQQASKLRLYEPVLAQADWISAISLRNAGYYARHNPRVQVMPLFHPFVRHAVRPGKGRYLLYNGNLGEAETRKVALFMIREVCPQLPFPVIIAGKGPDNELRKEAARLKHVILKPNPEPATMQQLVQEAQIILLPAFHPNGLKMKLIQALYRGRHVIVNDNMVAGTGLESLCTLANTPAAMIRVARQLFQIPFDKTAKANKRRKALDEGFHTPTHARRLLAMLFPESG